MRNRVRQLWLAAAAFAAGTHRQWEGSLDRFVQRLTFNVLNFGCHLVSFIRALR